MKNIYLLGGLGADERVFDNLEFNGYNPVFIPPLSPMRAETISAHALRLSSVINDNEPILVGVSFGGMLAVEIGKVLRCQKIIIISSIKNRSELPFYYRWLGKMQVHRLIPTSLLKKGNSISYWFFDVKQREEKALLRETFRQTDSGYIRWAIGQIVKWENATSNPSIFHIHGEMDRLFPVRYVQPDARVERGGHLMVLNRSDEINEIIRSCLNDKSGK